MIQSNPDYVLLLNNDTTIDENFLHELVKLTEENYSIGSVQSLLLKPGGKIIDSMGQELTSWSAQDIGMEKNIMFWKKILKYLGLVPLRLFTELMFW